MMRHSKQSHVTKRKRNAGVSLLEVMVALAIIALVAGLAAPRLIESFGRAKTQAAKTQMGNIKGALQLFYIDMGRYPSEAEGLEALLTAPSGAADWLGPYLDNQEDILDPWKRRYIYRFPGSNGSFDILSYGRDGAAGGTREDSDISL